MPVAVPPLPPRRALADDVYDAVLGLLMDHAVEPGSRVSIEGVSRQLQVSPTPVREALARLESEGLVSKSAGKGYRAADLLDANGLRQLYEIRILLETEGARLAASRVTPEKLDELARLLDASVATIDHNSPDDERYASYRAFAEQDAEFHRLIVEDSGNPLISDAVVRLRSHMHLYRLYFRHGIAAETAQEHAQILTALRSRNPEAARVAMHDHIERSYTRLADGISVARPVSA